MKYKPHDSSFKSYQAKRFRSLLKVRPTVKRIVGLTGTPTSNGLMDLWAQFRLLDMGERLNRKKITAAVKRIAGDVKLDLVIVPQDEHLARNQDGRFRCGDNGIFKGVPVTEEQWSLSDIARRIYKESPYDGKYIMNGDRLLICQSNAKADALSKVFPSAEINPLGDWSGGYNVDTGATNRKLGSDMADSHLQAFGSAVLSHRQLLPGERTGAGHLRRQRFHSHGL